MHARSGRSERWKERVRMWALSLGTAAFAAILLFHLMQLAGYERGMRSKFAYMRRAINFAMT